MFANCSPSSALCRLKMYWQWRLQVLITKIPTTTFDHLWIASHDMPISTDLWYCYHSSDNSNGKKFQTNLVWTSLHSAFYHYTLLSPLLPLYPHGFHCINCGHIEGFLITHWRNNQPNKTRISSQKCSFYILQLFFAAFLVTSSWKIWILPYKLLLWKWSYWNWIVYPCW